MRTLFKICCIVLATAPVILAQGLPGMNASGNGFYRFDAQPTWLHGFHRSASPFSGHASFRPSNYQQAIARADYMRMYPEKFLSSYRRPTAVESYRMYRAINSKATSVLPGDSARPVSSRMSPIHSLRIGRTVPLPEKAHRPPQVIRALQREETGPLFPLPPMP